MDVAYRRFLRPVVRPPHNIKWTWMDTIRIMAWKLSYLEWARSGLHRADSIQIMVGNLYATRFEFGTIFLNTTSACLDQTGYGLATRVAWTLAAQNLVGIVWSHFFRLKGLNNGKLLLQMQVSGIRCCHMLPHFFAFNLPNVIYVDLSCIYGVGLRFSLCLKQVAQRCTQRWPLERLLPHITAPCYWKMPQLKDSAQLAHARNVRPQCYKWWNAPPYGWYMWFLDGNCPPCAHYDRYIWLTSLPLGFMPFGLPSTSMWFVNLLLISGQTRFKPLSSLWSQVYARCMFTPHCFARGLEQKGLIRLIFWITFPCRIDIFDFGPTGTGRTIGSIPNAKNNRKLSIIGAPGSEPCQRQREKEKRKKKIWIQIGRMNGVAIGTGGYRKWFDHKCDHKFNLPDVPAASNDAELGF